MIEDASWAGFSNAWSMLHIANHSSAAAGSQWASLATSSGAAVSGDVTMALGVAIGREGISATSDGLEKLNKGQRDRVEHKHGTYDAADGPS
jgi:hypothetical protein